MRHGWKTFLRHFMAVFLAVLTLPLRGMAAEQVPEELQQLYAQSAVLMDADSGRILFEKNGQEVRPMASTTKIMTLIVTLENADPQGIVTVSEYAAGMPDVQLQIRAGEQYRLEDLLYSLMLESHNDSAVAIAEHVAAALQTDGESGPDGQGEPQEPQNGRSREESRALVADFAALMNAKARDIGCYDTHFVTPNGLDGEDEGGIHGTTAEDLAIILRYCILLSPRKDAFLSITRQAEHSFTDLSGSRSFSVQNHNAFLQMMEGALTGKTGFTSQAGYCYVGALTRDGRTYIAALLACGWPNHKSYKWSDMKKLMNYGLSNYTYHMFAEAAPDFGQLSPIPVEGGRPENLGEAVFVRPLPVGESKEGSEEEGSNQGLLLRSGETIQVRCRLKEKLTAPVKEKEPVGSVQYLVNGEVFHTELLVADRSVEQVDYGWCLEQVAASLLF